eukprot:6609655-Alexandrium_andersonii.AAC.1
MSASLVGSEMCIRDRVRSPTVESVFERSWAILVIRDKCLGAALMCISPVSYTHLTLPTICSV